jgi:hypothetical protein
MNFLNPIFLAALTAVAVPLLIHLFSRRKVREVPFSTLMFLRRSDRRSMRRVNLRRTLLLILRMIIVALLALAFARPIMRGEVAAMFPAGGSREAGILIDRSYSMGTQDENGVVFDRARMKVMEILDNLEEEDAIDLITFSNGIRVWYTGRNLNRVVLEKELESLRPSFGETYLRSSVKRAMDLLTESKRPVKELYVVSDFQRSCLDARAVGEGERKDQEREDQEREDHERDKIPVRVYLIPVQTGGGGNVSIRKVFTPRVVLHRGEIVSITVELKNNSRAVQAKFPLRILLEGERVIEKEIKLLPAEMKRETFVLQVEQEGWLEGEVRIGRDRLPADDSRFFVLFAREKVRALLVSGNGGVYLRRALVPGGGEGDITVDVTSWENITSRDLENTEVLILGEGRGPLRSDREMFVDFVRDGGKMVVFVLPKLRELVTDMSRFNPDIQFRKLKQGFVSPRVPNESIPLLSPFSHKDLEEFSRIRIVEYPLVSGIHYSNVLIKFSDEFPLIWEERLGEGYVRFISIVPSPEAGEMVFSPYFLPLVHQSVLTLGGESEKKEGVVVGEKLLLAGEDDNDLVCLLPDGSEARPEKADREDLDEALVRNIRLLVWSYIHGGGERYLVETGEQPGYLTVMEDGVVREKIAVNPDCQRESELEPADMREVADSLGIDKYVVLKEKQKADQVIKEARGGKEISGFLVLVALVVFVGELFVSQRGVTGVGD